MIKTVTAITEISILRAEKGEEFHIYNETTTRIGIDSEGDGHYLTIRQCHDKEEKIRIDPDEWDAIKAAGDRMIAEIIALDLHGVES